VSVILVAREGGERKGRMLDEGAQSVLEHYRAFGKVMEIDTEEKSSSVLQRVIQAVEV
jgi:hypothetical protein